MNRYLHRSQFIIHVLLISSVLVIGGLLVTEYIFFRTQVQQLLLLQHEYRTYVQVYRDWWDTTYNNSGEQSEQATGQFNAVNRDVSYLRDCALSFGQEHNIPAVVGVVQDWYIAPPYHSPIVQKPTSKISLRRAKPSAPRTHIPRKQSLGVQQHKKSDFVLHLPIKKQEFWVSSYFGPRKKKDGSWGFHYGIDFAALKGTMVYACTAGRVVEISQKKLGYGNSIKITHGDFDTFYAHLDVILVQPGQRVRTGEPIGRVGDTGSVRGKNASHLHLELHAFGKRINPAYTLKW